MLGERPSFVYSPMTLNRHVVKTRHESLVMLLLSSNLSRAIECAPLYPPLSLTLLRFIAPFGIMLIFLGFSPRAATVCLHVSMAIACSLAQLAWTTPPLTAGAPVEWSFRPLRLAPASSRAVATGNRTPRSLGRRRRPPPRGGRCNGDPGGDGS